MLGLRKTESFPDFVQEVLNPDFAVRRTGV